MGPSITTRGMKLGLGLMVATAILLFIGWFGTLAANPDKFVLTGDFGALLTGAQILREGRGAQLYDLATQQAVQTRLLAPYLTRDETLPYNHPPSDAVIGALLLDLTYPASYAIWTVAAALAIILSLWLLARALPLARNLRPLMLTGVASYPFLYSGLWLGQSTPFTLLGLCGTFAALRAGRPYWAGVALSFLALRPQLVPPLLLLLALQRHWRTLLTGAALVGAGVIALFPLLGPTWPLSYVRLLLTSASWPQGVSFNAAGMPNLRGLALALLETHLPGLVPALVLLLSALAGAWLLACWRWTRQSGAGDELLWAVAIVIMLLVTYHLNPHELTFLIFPAWIILARLPGFAPVRPWVALLWGWYLARWLALLPGYPATSTVPTVLLLVLGALLLGGQIARDARRRDAPRRGTTPGLHTRDNPLRAAPESP